MKNFLLIIAFAFSLITSYTQENIDSNSVAIQPIKNEVVQATIITRCSVTATSAKPLIVVDGVLMENKELKDIPEEDILTIDILKDDSFVRCRPNSGVIIITTKDANKKKIIIKDKESGDIIPGATLKIISYGKDTVNLVANEKGEVKIEKDQKKKYYTIMASSVGYKPYHMDVNIYRNNEIEMEREIISCYDVVVNTGIHTICRSFTCGTSGVRVCYVENNFKGSKAEGKAFKTYPNPATPGSSITIEFIHPVTGDFDVKIFSLSGQKVYESEIFSKSSKLQVPLSGFVKGSYLVKLAHRQRNQTFTEKIIVL